MRHVKIASRFSLFFFSRKIPAGIPEGEGFFPPCETRRSKSPDVSRASYVAHVIRPMAGDVIGETYRKSLLLYSGANSRVVRLSIGH